MKLFKILVITLAGFLITALLTAIITQTILDFREIGDTTWPIEIGMWGAGISFFLGMIFIGANIKTQKHRYLITFLALLIVAIIIWQPLLDLIHEVQFLMERANKYGK